MSLRDTKQEILDLLDESLAAIASREPIELCADAFELAEEGLEALACCKLLMELDVERFHRDLVWSGFARRRFLERCQAEKVDDHRTARSRGSSFFGALAAGHLALAAELGDLAPATFRADGEYEEDFTWFLFVHRASAGADAGVLGPLLERVEAVQRKSSPRLAVGQALAAGDAAAFEAAFSDLVDARNEVVDAERKLFADDPTHGPRASIFVEGLALLRVAELRGLPIKRREYPRVPFVARATRAAPPEDFIEEVERAGSV